MNDSHPTGVLHSRGIVETATASQDRSMVSRGEAFWVWLKIGLLSFGGPAGQIALMHRILVDEKKWLSETRFLHALNFCMILPGPEAQQLATYTGWLLHGIRGGLVAGLLFILPGALVIFALSTLYATAGQWPLLAGLFIGFKGAVIAIVLQALVRIGRRSLANRFLAGLAVVAFVAMFVFKVPFPLVVLAAAILGIVAASVSRKNKAESNEVAAGAATNSELSMPDPLIPRASTWRYSLTLMVVFGLLWLGPVATLYLVAGPDNVFANIGSFFSKMAVVTFGGAYAVLSYVAQEAVVVQHWLVPGEMIDGLALAETTPGPLILVVQFVGFMAAYRDPGILAPWVSGLLGGFLTLWVTFVPCFLWIFLGAPHIERLRNNRWLRGGLAAVTAAVVGVIANLAVWFTVHALFVDVDTFGFAGLAIEIPVWSTIHWWTLVITLVALWLTFLRKSSVVIALLVTGSMGVAGELF